MTDIASVATAGVMHRLWRLFAGMGACRPEPQMNDDLEQRATSCATMRAALRRIVRLRLWVIDPKIGP